MTHRPQWRPSQLATLEPSVPGEDTLRPMNKSRKSSMGIDKRVYTTDAEHPHSVSPFLHNNMVRDYRRNVQGRTYLIRQGGDALYHRFDPVANGYAYNADLVPVPRPDMTLAVDVTTRMNQEEPYNGVRFGPRRHTDRVRGQNSSREYMGHYTQPENHRGRWYGAGGQGR